MIFASYGTGCNPYHKTKFGATYLGNSLDLMAIVFDQFAGSNMTDRVAEILHRRWLAFELDEDYLKSSKLIFTDLL